MNELALGTWQFGPGFGYWLDQKTEESQRVIRQAITRGIRRFDTAYSYCNAESLLSPFLRGNELLIIDKVMPVPTLERKLMTSLLRLGRKSIDTLLLHWPGDKAALEESFKTLERLKDKGLISHYGVSNFPLSLLSQYDEWAIDAIEVPISLLWMKDAEAMWEYTRSKEITLIGYSPLGMGLATGKYPRRECLTDERQNNEAFAHMSEYSSLLDLIRCIAKEKGSTMANIAIAWAREKADITVLGCRNLGQLAENLDTVKLEDEEVKVLTRSAYALCSTYSSENPFNHRWQ